MELYLKAQLDCILFNRTATIKWNSDILAIKKTNTYHLTHCRAPLLITIKKRLQETGETQDKITQEVHNLNTPA